MARVTTIMVDIKACIMAYIEGGIINHIPWLLWQLTHLIVLILLSLTKEYIYYDTNCLVFSLNEFLNSYTAVLNLEDDLLVLIY